MSTEHSTIEAKVGESVTLTFKLTNFAEADRVGYALGWTINVYNYFGVLGPASSTPRVGYQLNLAADGKSCTIALFLLMILRGFSLLLNTLLYKLTMFAVISNNC